MRYDGEPKYWAAYWSVRNIMGRRMPASPIRWWSLKFKSTFAISGVYNDAAKTGNGCPVIRSSGSASAKSCAWTIWAVSCFSTSVHTRHNWYLSASAQTQSAHGFGTSRFVIPRQAVAVYLAGGEVTTLSRYRKNVVMSPVCPLWRWLWERSERDVEISRDTTVGWAHQAVLASCSRRVNTHCLLFRHRHYRRRLKSSPSPTWV